jgi:hypothetical protein
MKRTRRQSRALLLLCVNDHILYLFIHLRELYAMYRFAFLEFHLISQELCESNLMYAILVSCKSSIHTQTPYPEIFAK